MKLSTRMQACYGHTEGTAGITGLLLAASALQEGASVPIVNLRDINPYVGAAIGDMKHMSAHGPRQLAPGVLLRVGTKPNSASQLCNAHESHAESHVAYDLLSQSREGDSFNRGPVRRGRWQQEPLHLA